MDSCEGYPTAEMGSRAGMEPRHAADSYEFMKLRGEAVRILKFSGEMQRAGTNGANRTMYFMMCTVYSANYLFQVQKSVTAFSYE